MLREMEMQDRGGGSGNQDQDAPVSAMTTGARGMARRGSPRVALDAEPFADKRQSVRFEPQDDQDMNRYSAVTSQNLGVNVCDVKP